MSSTDPSREARTTRRHWWQIRTDRRDRAIDHPGPDEEPVEEDGTYVPDQVPEEWVDNQTAHRVNR